MIMLRRNRNRAYRIIFTHTIRLLQAILIVWTICKNGIATMRQIILIRLSGPALIELDMLTDNNEGFSPSTQYWTTRSLLCDLQCKSIPTENLSSRDAVTTHCNYPRLVVCAYIYARVGTIINESSCVPISRSALRLPVMSLQTI